MSLPTYNIRESYDWNYENAPAQPPEIDVPPYSGVWDFCGIPVNSPLGMPAGPILNSQWVLYYAALGFDVLVYKTVRSRYRACYDLPNLLPVRAALLAKEGSVVEADREASEIHTWAISFGMPSKEPAVWTKDVERARRGLGSGQALVVSVVASPEADWTMDRLADDFAQCAVWAAEAGADAIEANLSCPNVCTQETDLYLSPEAAGQISATIRSRVPGLPLVLKIGLFPDPETMEAVVAAASPYATALSSVNSITAFVRDEFGGLRRGVGGAAITGRCLRETAMLAEVIRRKGSPLRLISVGGVMNAGDVAARLDAGAHHVQLATAPMLDPMAGIKIRGALYQASVAVRGSSSGFGR